MAKQPTRNPRPSPVAQAQPAAPADRTTSLADQWKAWATPHRLRALTAIVVIAVGFFVALRFLAPHRSFHQDELTNIRMHALREKGIAAEEQHRTFHEFYAWWLADRFNESEARLPSTVAVTLSLLLLAALAGRLGGHRAAVAAAVLYVCWPRAWDDGLEMRYYSAVMLGALVGLHALLSLFRGAALWPFVAMVASFVALRRWHPTAVPFHLGLLAIAMAVCLTRVLTLATRKRPADAPFPWAAIVPPAAVVLLGAIGVAVVAPRLAADLRLGKLLEAGEGMADWKLSPLDLVRWLFGWVDDRLALETPLVRVVRLGFAGLVAVGVWRLGRHHRELALAGAALVLSQIVAAAIVQHSWSRLAVGYKYMTSSSALLLVAMALGLAALVTWVQRQRPARRWAAMALALGLYFLPLAPRLGLSIMGDGSHFRQAWNLIFAQSGDVVPLVVGRAEFTQSEWGYRRLIPDFQAMVWSDDQIGTAAIPYLSVRRRPVFLAYSPENEGLAGKGYFEKLESYRSNFTPNWDFDLYTKRGDKQVAAGGWADLKPGTSILVAETSRWEIAGTATLDGWPAPPDRRAEIAGGTLLRVREAAPGARLIPDFSEPVVRQGAFAQKGEMDAWNKVVLREGRAVYRLSNNYSIEYDFLLPEGPSCLSLETLIDDPTGGGFMLELNGELIGLYAVPDQLKAGTFAIYRMEIPERFAGLQVVATLTNLAENSARKADSEKVRVSTIESITLEKRVEGQQVSPNHLTSIPLAEPPPFAPGGAIRLADSLSKDVFTILSESTAKGSLWIENGNLCISPANPSAYQNVYTPRWHVKPNTYLAPEIEIRTRNLRSTNLVPVIHMFDEAGKTVKSDVFSAMPISRSDVDWVRRVGLVLVPEKAVSASLMFYVNDDKGEPNPPDAAFELRSVRLAR